MSNKEKPTLHSSSSPSISKTPTGKSPSRKSAEISSVNFSGVSGDFEAAQKAYEMQMSTPTMKSAQTVSNETVNEPIDANKKKTEISKQPNYSSGYQKSSSNATGYNPSGTNFSGVSGDFDAAQKAYEMQMSTPMRKSDPGTVRQKSSSYQEKPNLYSGQSGSISTQPKTTVDSSSVSGVSGNFDVAQKAYEIQMSTPTQKQEMSSVSKPDLSATGSAPTVNKPRSSVDISNASGISVSGVSGNLDAAQKIYDMQMSMPSRMYDQMIENKGSTVEKPDWAKLSVDPSGLSNISEPKVSSGVDTAQKAYDAKMSMPSGIQGDKSNALSSGTLRGTQHPSPSTSGIGISGVSGNFDAAQSAYDMQMHTPSRLREQMAEGGTASSGSEKNTPQWAKLRVDPTGVAGVGIPGVNGSIGSAQQPNNLHTKTAPFTPGQPFAFNMETPIYSGGQQFGVTNMMSGESTVSRGNGPPPPGTGNGMSYIQMREAGAIQTMDASMAKPPFQSKDSANTTNNSVNGNAQTKQGNYNKILFTHGRRIQVVNLEKAVTRQSLTMASRLIMSNSAEAGRGMQQTLEIGEAAYLAVGIHAVNLARAAVNAPLKSELNGMLTKYGAKNTGHLLKILNNELIANGMKAIPAGVQGAQLQILANRQLRRLKMAGGAPNAVTNTYKEIRRVGLLTTFTRSRPNVMHRLSRNVGRVTGKVAKYAGKYGGEAGQGLALVLRMSNQALRATRVTVKAIRTTGRITALVAKRAANAAAKGVLKGLQSAANAAARAGATTAASNLSGAVSHLQSMSERKAQKKAEKMAKKQRKKSKPSLRSRIKNKIRGKIRGFAGRVWNKMVNRVPGLRHVQKAFQKLGKVGGLFSKVLGAVSAAIQRTLQFFGMAVIAFIIVAIICTFFTSLFTATLGSFDFTNSKDKQQKKVISAVEEAYQEDMDKILELSKDYESFTISYEYDKDEEKYKEMQGKADSEQFMQTSNCAEVLSMTLVKYGYDLGSGEKANADTSGSGSEEAGSGQTEIITEPAHKYAKRLYHGSHQIEIQESISYEYDENGDVVATHKTANAIYRTYCFDSIFQCTEADSTAIVYGSVGGDGTVSGAMNVDQVYAYLRDQGFTHAGACGIMGNLQQESSFNPLCTSKSGQYFGIEQLGYDGRRQALEAYCTTNGLDYKTIAGQISYLVYELTASSNPGSIGKRSTLVSILQNTDDVQKAAEVFCVGVERCVGGSDPYHYKSEYWPYSAGTSYSYQQLTKRVSYAQQFASKYDAYKNDWSAISAPTTSGTSGNGSSIVAYAESWVGSSIKYQLGGSGRGQTLETCQSKGLKTDCSGFVNSVFKHFGISVPMSSTAAWNSKLVVKDSEKQPGDIIVWSGHVAIYIGNKTVNGKTYDIVHMSNPSTNICYGTIATARSGSYKVYRYATQGSSAAGSGVWDLQTNYPRTGQYTYGKFNGEYRYIYDSACGPTSLANIVRNLCGVNVTTVEMCNYSINVGARQSGGTDMATLISKASKKWNFSYSKTSSATTVYNHCKNGGMAIAHTSGSQPFSSGGHFMAAVGTNGSNVVLIDPYYYPSKKDKYAKAGCTVTSTNGMYYVPTNVLGRCDYFYLISKK